MRVNFYSWLTLMMAAFVLLSEVSGAEKLTSMRVWHGANGKSFKGQFMDREGEVIHLVDVRGKVYKVPLSSLSENDRAWFNEAWANNQQKENKIEGLMKPGQVVFQEGHQLLPVAPIGFQRVKANKVTRLNIPQIDQSEYHNEDTNTLYASFVPFMLWWHNYKVVDVPIRRDDNEKRIIWLYKTLNKADLNTNYSDVRPFQKFFQKELKTDACFQILDLRMGARFRNIEKDKNKIIDRFSPEFLSQYCQGANATILTLQVYKNGRHTWSPEVPLVECRPTGEVVFYMYGNVKLTGRLEKKPPTKKRQHVRASNQPRYQIVIDNMVDTPGWFRNNNYTFFLEGGQMNGLMVIIPNMAEKIDLKENQ